MKEVALIDLGLIAYEDGWAIQERLFNETIQTKIGLRNNSLPLSATTENYLIFCEHPHVYTLGKTGSEDHLLLNEKELKEKNATYHRINRGGDITYHGPGQIVGYPIFDLDHFFTDIGKYLRYIEDVIILTLSDFGITAGRIKGATGVWLDPESDTLARKICAIGVRTSRWVTMHGFALNVNPNLDYFGNIVPCGISDKSVTSMQVELGKEIPLDEVKKRIKMHFEELFKIRLLPQSI